AGRDAIRAEDRAAAALERLEAQRADLEGRRARSAAEQDEAASELARADAIRAALPDGAETRAHVATLTADAEAGRAAVASARAERGTVERDIAMARERLAAARAESQSWTARAGEA